MVTYIVQHLRGLKVFFGVLVLSAIIAGCGKSGNVKWVHYDETYCSDKWDYNASNEKLKENVVNYLDKNGVKVFEIEIFNDITPDACTDCTCKTGRRMKCKIKKREVKNVKSLGFYE
jgi:hypothetical protein